MANTKSGLGTKGFNALFNDNEENVKVDIADDIQAQEIDITLIDRNPNQPRKTFLVSCQVSGKLHSETSWKRMWESYMNTMNAKYGDFSSVIGTAPKKSQKKRPMIIQTFTPHQLRHTYITMLYLAGVDVMTAKEQAGHLFQ